MQFIYLYSKTVLEYKINMVLFPFEDFDIKWKNE